MPTFCDLCPAPSPAKGVASACSFTTLTQIANTPTTATATSAKLDKALDLADAHGWFVADMNQDWEKVFPEK